MDNYYWIASSQAHRNDKGKIVVATPAVAKYAMTCQRATARVAATVHTTNGIAIDFLNKKKEGAISRTFSRFISV